MPCNIRDVVHAGTDQMEIIHAGEAYAKVGAKYHFARTKVVIRHRDNYYYAVTTRRGEDALMLDPRKLIKTQIPTSSIFPRATSDITMAPKSLPTSCFIKSPNLLYFGDHELTENYSDFMLNEILAYEIISKSPHPNLGRYYGCVISGGRIRGTCVGNYDMYLETYLEQNRDQDFGDCWRQIKSGLEHLHRLGIVHCDLNPRKIMMLGDTPVIVGFEFCRKPGGKLIVTGGKVIWISHGFQFADKAMDREKLEDLRRYMGVPLPPLESLR